MSRISELLAEAVLFHDYRSGSFRDWSGNDNRGVPTDVRFTGNGLAFDESTSVVTVADSPELQGDEFTLVLFNSNGMTQLGDVYGRLFSRRDAATYNYEWRATVGGIIFATPAGNVSITHEMSGSKYEAINVADGETPEQFSNGLSVGLYTGPTSVSAGVAVQLLIGNVYNNTARLEGGVTAALIFPRKLTATEHALLFGHLSAMRWPSKASVVSNASIGIDPGESGLVASYSMAPNGGKVIDLSGGGNDGVIHGNPMHQRGRFGDSLRFDGQTLAGVDVTGLTIPSGNQTYEFWLKIGIPELTPTFLFDTQSGRRIIAVDRTDGQGLQIFDQNVASWKFFGVRVDDRLVHHVVVRFTGTTAELFVDGEQAGATLSVADVAVGGACIIGSRYSMDNYSTLFAGNMYSAKFYGHARTAKQIKDEYRRGLTALWHMDYGVRESVVEDLSEYIENTPFRVYPGTGLGVRVNEIDLNGMPTKVMYGSDSGEWYMPTDAMGQTPEEAAYGEWSGYVYIPDGYNFGVDLISNVPDTGAFEQTGYSLALGVNGTAQVGLYKKDPFPSYGSYIMQSSQGSFPEDEWFHFRVTRTKDGEFSIYINGELVNADNMGTNPITDNTYTESLFFGMDQRVDTSIALASINGEHALTKRVLS